MGDNTLELLIQPEDIQTRVAQLAAEIRTEMGDADVVLVGILNGSFMFLGDLARNLNLPKAKVDFIRLASYGDATESSGSIKMKKDLECDLSGCRVLIVEDIVDTGLTLHWMRDHLRDCGAERVYICALIDKKERREVELDIDFAGFELPEGFLVGYGLDYNEQYRCLPGIYNLKL